MGLRFLRLISEQQEEKRERSLDYRHIIGGLKKDLLEKLKDNLEDNDVVLIEVTNKANLVHFQAILESKDIKDAYVYRQVSPVLYEFRSKLILL